MRVIFELDNGGSVAVQHLDEPDTDDLFLTGARHDGISICLRVMPDEARGIASMLFHLLPERGEEKE